MAFLHESRAHPPLWSARSDCDRGYTASKSTDGRSAGAGRGSWRYAEFAVASANMVDVKPQRLTNLEAGSMPVVAVTAWQMLFEHARPEPGHTIMILGAAGNVGAYARFALFYAEVTTERLSAISGLLDSGKVIPQVGSVLPLSDVRTAHEMLAGAPHRRGKIALQVEM